jgi:tRNA dimethylallyltransferase
MTRVFLLMGPTASGKSALALELAEAVGGEIINADSMQVYGDLHVLTARPSVADDERVPHHMYGHVDASQRFSVGQWRDGALKMIRIVEKRGKLPIIVGGTGLYFNALTKGLVDIPAADEDVRAELQLRLAREGAPALHAELDAESAARVSANDAPRILRALEVLQTTGRSIVAHHADTQPALPRSEWAGMCLKPPREALYAAIDQRFSAMLEAGALSEVRALAARGLDPMMPAMKAHGAPALMAHLRGELSLDDAAEIARRDTRRYAKRQFTWMAGQMEDWTAEPSVEPAVRIDCALKLLRG